MKLIDSKISKAELSALAQNRFGEMIKAVVDLEKQIMVVDADLHADQEKYLLDLGSKQQHLWGINLYPNMEGDDWLEFDSMINLRPSSNNFSRGVDDLHLQDQIRKLVEKLTTT